MLELRPNCECCDQDLPADTGLAYICSFECTFCADCSEHYLQLICPNCGGELLRRPHRPTSKLAANPASIKRVFNPALKAALARGARAAALPLGQRLPTSTSTLMVLDLLR